MSDELVLKVENVKKRYRLGVIGGGTLQGDLQSWWARIRGKEDPNQKIGMENNTKKGTFMALDGISFEVKKGERLGIIGGNGAGKSTTLKILSRVTAPTEGTVYINGRISSMLEVGTGFHPELTGRENIYLNGAILGMTKAEVDQKMDAIIKFSECGRFIDTPVKRYSSGMYVKLAFSVAAHLDSEIMIMDEVLAVGDINFQQKCIKKMRDVAENEGRTILYVSHNMNTVKQLCNKCIVLDKGRIIFEGQTEDAIDIYSQSKKFDLRKEIDLSKAKRIGELKQNVVMKKLTIKENIIEQNSSLFFELEIDAKINIKTALLRFVVFDRIGRVIGTTYSREFSLKEKENIVEFEFSVRNLAPSEYIADIILCEYNGEIQIRHDIVLQQLSFAIEETEEIYNMKWNRNGWGTVVFAPIEVKCHG